MKRVFIGRGLPQQIPDRESMTMPELYRPYKKAEVIALFGSDAAAKRLCNDQWIISPARIVCLATLGDPTQAPHFLGAARFCWTADENYRVGRDSRYPTCFPTEAIGGHTEGRTLHLFVRSNTSQKYIYAGEMSPTYAMAYAGKHNYGQADFELSRALPSAVWTQLGGLHVGDTDHAAVDTALDRLRADTTWEERFAVLKRLVEYWHGPIHASDGMTEAELAGIQMPTVLHDWYRWAGNRGGILTGQNFLFKPRDERHRYWELKLDDGRLRFYVENQGVYEWATLADGDDPPVFGRYTGLENTWEPEDVSLSEHLILACLFEAVGLSKYGASAAWLDHNVINEIASTIPPIAIGEWRWLDGARFHARHGAFMITCQNSDDWQGGSVWIGAKTEHPLQFLRPYLDKSWEHVAL